MKTLRKKLEHAKKFTFKTPTPAGPSGSPLSAPFFPPPSLSPSASPPPFLGTALVPFEPKTTSLQTQLELMEVNLQKKVAEQIAQQTSQLSRQLAEQVEKAFKEITPATHSCNWPPYAYPRYEDDFYVPPRPEWSQFQRLPQRLPYPLPQRPVVSDALNTLENLLKSHFASKPN